MKNPVELSEEYQSVYNRVSLLRSDEAKLIYAMGELQKEIMHAEMQRDSAIDDLKSVEARLEAAKSALTSTEAAYNEVYEKLNIAKQNTMLEEKNKNMAIEARKEEEKRLSEIVLQGRKEEERRQEERDKLEIEKSEFQTRKANLISLLQTL